MDPNLTSSLDIFVERNPFCSGRTHEVIFVSRLEPNGLWITFTLCRRLVRTTRSIVNLYLSAGLVVDVLIKMELLSHQSASLIATVRY